MSHSAMQMEYDFDLAVECCEAFAQSTNLGCTISDADGGIFYSTGLCCANCKLCAIAGQQPDSCVQSHIYAMREAERFGGRFVYFCPMGLTCFVSPLKGSITNSAKMIAGPFLMVELEDYISYDLEIVHQLSKETICRCREILADYPYVSAERVAAMSTMLFMSVSFLNDVAVSLHMLNTINRDAMQGRINDRVAELKGEKYQPYPIESENRMLHCIANANKEQAKVLLNDLMAYYFYTSSGDIASIRIRCMELHALMSRAAVDGGANGDLILSHDEKYYESLQKQTTFEGICNWSAADLDNLIDTVRKNANIKRIDVIHKAIQYIQENYNQKITLANVAQMVYLSPAYFSKVFKEEMGCSFREYLNAFRIEKSMAMLLNENTKASSIAFMVGFDDQSYFTKVFKRIVGITPNQYRETQGRLKLGSGIGGR